MLDIKRMRFPLDIILVCIRWYAAYPLSYRHLEEMMQERGVIVDHSSINRWAIRFLPLLEKVFRCQYKRHVGSFEPRLGSLLLWLGFARLLKPVCGCLADDSTVMATT